MLLRGAKYRSNFIYKENFLIKYNKKFDFSDELLYIILDDIFLTLKEYIKVKLLFNSFNILYERFFFTRIIHRNVITNTEIIKFLFYKNDYILLGYNIYNFNNLDFLKIFFFKNDYFNYRTILSKKYKHYEYNSLRYKILFYIYKNSFYSREYTKMIYMICPKNIKYILLKYIFNSRIVIFFNNLIYVNIKSNKKT